MRQVILIILIFNFGHSHSQSYTLESSLDNIVDETSGLIFIDNTLITHNDSANSNQLFEIDASTGSILRTVTISNASNADWEDLAHDNDYIYIGDFGNFDATRTNLRVYRVLKTDYFNSTEVTADIINFNYTEQTDFSVQEFTTNFDAETLVHFNNKLYIFTKNWADGNTNIYELPKTPGTYSLTTIDVINSQGLVTGGASSIDDTTIVLCGYDGSGPFLIELTGFSSGLFSNGSIIKTTVLPPSGFSFQTEGIAPQNSNVYYVSAEEANGNPQGLYSFNLSTLKNDNAAVKKIEVFPNPADKVVRINSENYISELYTLTGRLLTSSRSNVINISNIAEGCYVLKLVSKTDSKRTQNQLLLIKRN